MRHYPFHVGDYIRATAHLDVVEDCVYRRLIDLYMETELPIPNDNLGVIRRLRLGSSGLILEPILKEFFTLEADNCWHNSRCDAEISEFKRLAEVSRINGKLGGRPKKTQQVILDNPAGTQQEPIRLQPIPNTQYPSKQPTSTQPALVDVSQKPAAKPPASRGSRLSPDWQLPKSWGDWALQQRTDWTPEAVRKVAETFRDHWVAKAGANATKLDWEATWRNWVRKEPTSRPVGRLPVQDNFAERNYGQGGKL